MKISVITVCLNEKNTIERTIKSVLAQTYPNIEYFVVDGGSRDETIQILKEFELQVKTSHFAEASRDKQKLKFHWISKKDRGIYDAMNKGIHKIMGDYVYFLNAGDTFYNSRVLKSVAFELEKNKPDILYGNVSAIEGNRRRLDRFNNVHRWFLLNNTICHQAMFTKKTLYDRYGGFNTKYSIASDYDWLLNMIYKHFATATYFNKVITKFSLDGISNSSQHRKLVLKEYDSIRKKYFSSIEIVVHKVYLNIISVALCIKRIFL